MLQVEHYGAMATSSEISKKSLGNQTEVSCSTEVSVGTLDKMMLTRIVGVEPKRGPQKDRTTQSVQQLLGRAIGSMPHKPQRAADISVRPMSAATWTNKASGVELPKALGAQCAACWTLEL